MKRFKRHKVKEEKPEPSHSREPEDHDLAYYIHDRVELMHQVFSVIKPKELKTMAPDCIRDISIDDLQELCTEELLGISSKRLCAILDGAEPPSDTESSSQSPERLETISLDSISSDEEILSESSKKKKHKHKKHSKKKRKTSTTSDKNAISDKSHGTGDENKSRAARAGLTVLELLELQARARAIRAQLHQEQAKLATTSQPPEQQISSDDDAVQVKEEPTLVVEISSDEEKPNVEELKTKLQAPASSAKTNRQSQEPTQNTSNETAGKTSKRVNNLIITVPQAKTTRRIKLNRSKSVNQKNAEKDATPVVENNKSVASKNVDSVTNKKAESYNKKVEGAKKAKRVKKKKRKEKDGSDQDELMLQLSDTEKMDLLDDFEGKKIENRSSSSSEDSESSSSDSSDDASVKKDEGNTNKGDKENTEPALKENASEVIQNTDINNEIVDKDLPAQEKQTNNTTKDNLEEVKTELSNIEISGISEKDTVEREEESNDRSVEDIGANIETQLNISTKSSDAGEVNLPSVSNEPIEPMEVDVSPSEENIEISSVSDLPTVVDDSEKDELKCDEVTKPDSTDNENVETEKVEEENEDKSDEPELVSLQKKTLQVVLQGNNRSVQSKEVELATVKATVTVVKESDKVPEKNMSDGELSDAESSEVEAVDLRPEVVCISDEENKKDKSRKKKSKKKEKKAKKEKKKKSKSDFRETGDQNFFTEKRIVIKIVDNNDTNKNTSSSPRIKESEESNPITIDDDDDIFEILELSDDSSCYEVEGVSVLSKEPTAEEIAAFSAKLDEEFDQEDIVINDQTRDNEELEQAEQLNDNEQIAVEKETSNEETNNLKEIERVSWKDRYIGSKKVKRVLTTANILNAMRKKNKELKKKIEQAKKDLILQREQEIERQREKEREKQELAKKLEEGSIEQYNTLLGSTKYINPVPEKLTENGDLTDVAENVNASNNLGENKELTREMKKDAKNLLKMYKRLLKHNNMTKQKDPSKKKTKKSKKSKDKSVKTTITA